VTILELDPDHGAADVGGCDDPAVSKTRRKRLILLLQIVLLTAMVVFLTVEVKSSWGELKPRLEEMDYTHVLKAALILASYYLVFVIGWVMILRALKMRIGYADALGAEMLSMLAKYIPGGVWTPAARIVATRRLGLASGPVLASIGYEAGLSAIAGVIVFALAIPFEDGVDPPVPTWTIIAFAVLLVVLLHPRIYGRVADRFLPHDGDEPIPALPLVRAVPIVAYYCFTWVIGGIALWAMIRAFEPISIAHAPFLGGASAVGAIVAVLVVIAPSGLGVREGAVYALILAVASSSTALVVVAVNRLLITVVEAALLGGVSLWRRATAARAASRA
jgi:uncharacterized membrane protein YbhN (UPF0104 family)